MQDSLSPSGNKSGGSSGASKVQLHFFAFCRGAWDKRMLPRQSWMWARQVLNMQCFQAASPSCGLLHNLNHLLIPPKSSLNLANHSSTGLASTALLHHCLSLLSHFQVTFYLQPGHQHMSDCGCASNMVTTLWTFIKISYYILESTLSATPIMELITLGLTPGSCWLMHSLGKVSNLSFISSQVTAWIGWLWRVTTTPKIYL